MAAKTATKTVEASDVVEDVKDLVEDTIELTGSKVSWAVQNPKFLLASVLLAGGVIGSAATFLAVRKKLEAKYQAMADEQIADVKDHYSAIRKDDVSLEELASKYPDDEPVREAAKEIIDANGYTSYDRVETVIEEPKTVSVIVEQARVIEADEEITRNVFESDHPDTYFDFEEETARREAKPNDPFVITLDEFNENETDYDQATLTYYDGDDVLADSSDQPIDDMDKTVGVENMLRFGHGSTDPKIVYIRNAKLGLDFEVVHSDGKFAKEVLGFDDNLQHSDRRRPRKFRASDE